MVHGLLRDRSARLVRLPFRKTTSERSNPPTDDVPHRLAKCPNQSQRLGAVPRHTFVTDLAESGAGDEVIRDMAGHVSKEMLKHYSHIRTLAKRKAADALSVKPK